ncbi:hypothetical protein PMG11_03640 [Penicillium brasilianum]|uniref:Uncharacterized protein n=1 Tax=Penicillium brasilianum TaxID=104259 RepID=A0A0F7VAK3_PENBI|nr:hypothetical protein PMG11_03640 [Penicillium brasilianum]
MSVLDASKGSSIGRVTLLDEGIMDVPVLHGQPLQMEGSLHSGTPWLGKALALPSWRKAHWKQLCMPRRPTTTVGNAASQTNAQV